jgi:hypothetical protein
VVWDSDDIPDDASVSDYATIDVPRTTLPPYPGLDSDGENCVGEVEAATINVRSSGYAKHGRKQPSAPSAYRFLGTDLLLTDDAVGRCAHVSARANSFVQRFRDSAGAESPFVLVMNFILPWGNVVSYHAPDHGGSTPTVGDPAVDALLKRYLSGDASFCDKRLKIIARCIDAPWAVKKAVGSKPAILGTRLPATYHRGDRYFEISLDVGASRAASYILALVRKSASRVSMELSFILEGQAQTELPERVLFAWGFHHIATSAPVAPTWAAWEKSLAEDLAAEDGDGDGDGDGRPRAATVG